MQSLTDTFFAASPGYCNTIEIFTMSLSAVWGVMSQVLCGLAVGLLHFLMIIFTLGFFQLFAGPCGKVSDTLDLNIELIFWSAVSIDVVCVALYGLIAGPYYFVMLLVAMGAFKAAFCVSVKVAEAFGFNNRVVILWVMIVTALGLHPNIAM